MFNEKPPMLGGNVQADLAAMRDYLFRMARSLETATAAGGSGNVVVAGAAAPSAGGSGYSEEIKSDIEKVRRNAEELKALIIKNADELQSYTDSKVEEYNSLYVAKSEFGEFTETIQTTVTNTARGVVESYDYDALIQSNQDNINLMQNYLTSIDGEIRRGIVQDPETGDYVTGIAIAQALSFSGTCGPSDSRNPGDGYTYYYLTSGQTFGLYTSTGWQFWIDGYKKGWFNSIDGMLHIANVYVEQSLQLGNQWKLSYGTRTGELVYIGG